MCVSVSVILINVSKLYRFSPICGVVKILASSEAPSYGLTREERFALPTFEAKLVSPGNFPMRISPTREKEALSLSFSLFPPARRLDAPQFGRPTFRRRIFFSKAGERAERGAKTISRDYERKRMASCRFNKAVGRSSRYRARSRRFISVVFARGRERKREKGRFARRRNNRKKRPQFVYVCFRVRP